MTTYLSLLAVFTTSLLGSLHCVGMCGGFLSLYSFTPESPLKIISGHDRLARELSFHGFYNFGRLCVYLALGAFAGGIGATINRLVPDAGQTIGSTQSLFAIQQGVGLLAGLLIIAWGAAALLRETTNFALPLWLPRLGILQRFGGLYQRLTANVSSTKGPFLLGLLSGALPCGWLYAFVTIALGTGSPLMGLIVMGVFWLGTVPAMLVSGMVVLRLTGRLKRFAPICTALLVITLGLFTLSGKFAPHRHALAGGGEHEAVECSP